MAMLNPLTEKELAKESALFCLKIEQKLLDWFSSLKNRRYILAFSGGKDSMALCLAMSVLARKNGFFLIAVHINHCLRREADLDEQFCKAVCDKMQIPFISRHSDVATFAHNNKIGIEEAGHKLRYKILKEILVDTNGDAMLVAHHAGDLLEDIIMRLIRGAGWPALAGMKERTGNICRPLLYTLPTEIAELLKRENICWREDESNTDLAYFRNRVRHNLMPLFLKENPSMQKGVSNLNKMAVMEEDYWSGELKRYFAASAFINLHSPDFFVLLRNELLKEHQALRMRIYHFSFKLLAEQLGENFQGNAGNFFELDKGIINNRSNKIYQFPGNFQALLRGNFVRLGKSEL